VTFLRRLETTCDGLGVGNGVPKKMTSNLARSRFFLGFFGFLVGFLWVSCGFLGDSYYNELTMTVTNFQTFQMDAVHFVVLYAHGGSEDSP
jgi:hypothetical protein